MVRASCLFAVLAVVVLGCGGSSKDEVIAIKPAGDPLAPARTVLQRYADGQPLASEVTTFPQLVEDVRKADAAKADILEKGLEDLQKASPASRAAKAKELLKKL